MITIEDVSHSTPEAEHAEAASDMDAWPWQSPPDEVEGWVAAVALCFGQGSRWIDHERL